MDGCQPGIAQCSDGSRQLVVEARFWAVHDVEEPVVVLSKVQQARRSLMQHMGHLGRMCCIHSMDLENGV